jgi:hypothetical protein
MFKTIGASSRDKESKVASAQAMKVYKVSNSTAPLEGVECSM